MHGGRQHSNRCAAVSLLFALTAAVGCSSVDVREGGAPGVRVADSRAPHARVRFNAVTILDDSLQQWQGPREVRRGRIAVESTNVDLTPTSTMRAWALLRNRTDHPMQVEGRTQFFDRGQAPLEGPTPWRRVFLPPNGVASYEEYSTRMVGQCGYYLIEIREGR